MSDDERFFVDERTGCIAVRDRLLTDTDCQGLHPDMSGVVWYASFRQVDVKCECCGHVRQQWSIDPDLIEDANLRCRALNLIEEKSKGGGR